MKFVSELLIRFLRTLFVSALFVRLVCNLAVVCALLIAIEVTVAGMTWLCRAVRISVHSAYGVVHGVRMTPTAFNTISRNPHVLGYTALAILACNKVKDLNFSIVTMVAYLLLLAHSLKPFLKELHSEVFGPLAKRLRNCESLLRFHVQLNNTHRAFVASSRCMSRVTLSIML